MGEKKVTRRSFLSEGGKLAAGAVAGASVLNAVARERVLGANERINMAVIGIRSRGAQHYREWCKIPHVHVKTLCDVDEALFPDRVKELETLQDKRPGTEVDIRRVLEDKSIDAVSIATADHWHALAAIWACQAGKHVYVEKPSSHSIWESRKMVEAARRYGRIVSVGMQNRSLTGVQKAMAFLQEGKLGDVYMARGLCFKPRESIGKKPDGPVPQGLHWDLWLGPARWRSFNPNYVHYNWHWFWDFGCAEIGNQGPHQIDIARWGLNKKTHPRKIQSMGGYYAFQSDQETPNTQVATFLYDDGKIIQFEVRGLYTHSEDDIQIGNLFYGTEGWMHLDGANWKTYFGRSNEPGPSFSSQEAAADPSNLAGAGDSSHFVNFIDALRSNDLGRCTADIEEGHLSSTLCHLANISYRLGRTLEFDPHSETFVGDPIANGYLTREYRYPFVVPDKP